MAALAAVVFCLLAGVLAAVAPSASADAGEVTVTWPEMTTFNSDDSAYVIDVRWDGAGSLFLQYEEVDGSVVSRDELQHPGIQAVDFPFYDGADGDRVFKLFACPSDSWSLDDCTVASTSPQLSVSRANPADSPSPRFSVTWPDVNGVNPDRASYAPEISWDGVGSVFLEVVGGSSWPQHRYLQEIWSSGPHGVTFPEAVRNGDVEVDVFACSGRVLDITCSGTYSRFLPVYDSLKASVSPQRIGPLKPIDVEIEVPHANTTVTADWELSEAGTVVASGAVDLPFPSSQDSVLLPPLGNQPALVNEHVYSLRVTLSGDIRTFGTLTGTTPPVDVTWDNESDGYTVSTTSLDGQGHVVNTHAFYPARDNYRDTLTFQAQLGADIAAPRQVTIYDADGNLVTTLPSSRPWDGTDSQGQLVGAGRYSAEVLMVDAAANPTVRRVDVVVRAEHVTRVTWRHSIPADADITSSFHRCGGLKSPARPDWPGSLGYYTGSCDESPISQTIHEVAVPASVTGRYGKSRVSVLGGKALGTSRARLYIAYGPFVGSWRPASKIGGRLGLHHDIWDNALTVEGDDHTLRWKTQARDGDRYDVEKFVVQVRYDVLR